LSKQLYFVRHGEIPANKEGRYAGWSDEELTGDGFIQAQKTAERLKLLGVTTLYTSIGAVIGLTPIMEPSIKELKMGPWEGKFETDIVCNFEEEWKLWNTRPAELRLPGRERLQELLDRSQKFVIRVNAGNDTCAIVGVTHVAVMRVLYLFRNNLDLNLYRTIHVPNLAILDYNEGVFI